MAQGNYQNLLPLILKWEGGYSNHPADNGGETNFGVTWRRYNQYRKDKGLPQQSVKFISQDEVAEIYKDYYYDKVRGDELPPGLDYAMFDFAVNSGHTRAIKFVQGILGVKQDGVLGPDTMNAIHRANPQELASALNSQRLSWLKGLSDWQHFGAGWENRVNDVSAVTNRVASEAIANGYTPPPPAIQSTQPAASSSAPATSPRPFVKPPLISPGTPGTYTPPDRSSPHGFAKHDLIIYGGKNGDTFYHPYEYKAHDLNHSDYSQQFRDWRLFDSPDQIPAGFVDTGVRRDGKIVAASGRPEYLNGKPVSKDDFIREARARGGIIPRYNEMQALYSRIPGVNMPTSNLWGDKVGGVGTPDQYNEHLNPRLEAAGIGPNDPYYAGKEFYLSDNAAHTESWDVTGTGGTPPVYGESPGPAGPVTHPAPSQAEEDAGIIDKAMEVGKDMWGRLTDSLGLGDGAEGVPEPIDSPEAPPTGGAPQARGGPKQQLVQDVVVPTLEEQRELGPEPVAPQVIEPMPQAPPPVQESTPQLPPPIQTTPPPMETPAVPDGVYVTPSSVPAASGSYAAPPPVAMETLPPPESGGIGGSNFLAGIGSDLLKMGLSGLMGGGGGGMPLPPAPVVQAPPPPQIATGPVMFNIRKSKDKDKA